MLNIWPRQSVSSFHTGTHLAKIHSFKFSKHLRARLVAWWGEPGSHHSPRLTVARRRPCNTCLFGSLLHQSQAKQNGDWLLACTRNAESFQLRIAPHCMLWAWPGRNAQNFRSYGAWLAARFCIVWPGSRLHLGNQTRISCTPGAWFGTVRATKRPLRELLVTNALLLNQGMITLPTMQSKNENALPFPVYLLRFVMSNGLITFIMK